MAPGTGLVIFDCDGVLVDSERIANSVFAELITGIGLPTSFLKRFEGRIFSATEVPRGKPFPDLFLPALVVPALEGLAPKP